MSRTREELEEAAKRVLSDGALPLAKLCKRIPVERRGKWAHLSAGALSRWIIHGKRGAFLDGARLSGKGRFSSVAAQACEERHRRVRELRDQGSRFARRRDNWAFRTNW